jgi:hypothetical protein
MFIGICQFRLRCLQPGRTPPVAIGGCMPRAWPASRCSTARSTSVVALGQLGVGDDPEQRPVSAGSDVTCLVEGHGCTNALFTVFTALTRSLPWTLPWTLAPSEHGNDVGAIELAIQQPFRHRRVGNERMETPRDIVGVDTPRGLEPAGCSGYARPTGPPAHVRA